MGTLQIRRHIRSHAETYEHALLFLAIAVLCLDIVSAWIGTAPLGEEVELVLNATALAGAVGNAVYQWAHRRPLGESLLTACLVSVAMFVRVSNKQIS